VLNQLAGGLAVAGAFLSAAPAQEPPTECAVVGVHGRCLVVAVDPGRLDGGSTDEKRRPERRRAAPAGGPTVPATEDAPAAPPPSRRALPFGDGGWAVTEVPDILLPGDPAAAAAPQAAAVALDDLVRRAVDELLLAPPQPRISVTGGGYVGVPVWLWIENDGVSSIGPVSATATAGTARVTAVGRLTAVEWSMGPPGQTVRCTGPGTPWDGQAGESPDCGYTYTSRSLPERTDGTGSWPVTATGVWTVTWSGVSGGIPVDGADVVAISTAIRLPIGEVQVLVGGGDG
jgi:hypothetical protein